MNQSTPALRFRDLAGLALALSLAAAGPPTATAGTGADTRILLHVVPDPGPRGRDCLVPEIRSPENIRTRGGLAPATYLVYVLAAGFDTTAGLAGIQFGIDYDADPERGVDVLGWSHCATLEFHGDDWPRAGSGNLLTWSPSDDCQRRSPAVVGFFRVTAHSPGDLRLTPRPADGLAAVAGCAIRMSRVDENVDSLPQSHLGWVSFGGGSGFNPWTSARVDSIDSAGPGR